MTNNQAPPPKRGKYSTMPLEEDDEFEGRDRVGTSGSGDIGENQQLQKRCECKQCDYVSNRTRLRCCNVRRPEQLKNYGFCEEVSALPLKKNFFSFFGLIIRWKIGKYWANIFPLLAEQEFGYGEGKQIQFSSGSWPIFTWLPSIAYNIGNFFMTLGKILTRALTFSVFSSLSGTGAFFKTHPKGFVVFNSFWPILILYSSSVIRNFHFFFLSHKTCINGFQFWSNTGSNIRFRLVWILIGQVK